MYFELCQCVQGNLCNRRSPFSVSSEGPIYLFHLTPISHRSKALKVIEFHHQNLKSIVWVLDFSPTNPQTQTLCWCFCRMFPICRYGSWQWDGIYMAGRGSRIYWICSLVKLFTSSKWTDISIGIRQLTSSSDLLTFRDLGRENQQLDKSIIKTNIYSPEYLGNIFIFW